MLKIAVTWAGLHAVGGKIGKYNLSDHLTDSTEVSLNYTLFAGVSSLFKKIWHWVLTYRTYYQGIFTTLIYIISILRPQPCLLWEEISSSAASSFLLKSLSHKWPLCLEVQNALKHLTQLEANKSLKSLKNFPLFFWSNTCISELVLKLKRPKIYFPPSTN